MTIYNVNETFYSVQGEGCWTGAPAFFIRMAGCNLKCSFCDTDHSLKRKCTTAELLSEVERHPSKKVVITGGEPFLQDLEPLCNALAHNNYKIHIETNGTQEVSEELPFFWLTVSPKPDGLIDQTVISLVSEVKVICGPLGWWKIAEYCKDWPCEKFLQPAWTKSEILRDYNTQMAYRYCLEHPEWYLSLQVHKYIGAR